jgi:FkbM family methyltransferase
MFSVLWPKRCEHAELSAALQLPVHLTRNCCRLLQYNELVSKMLRGFYSWLLSLAGFTRISGHMLWAARIDDGWNLLDCGANRGVFLNRALAALPGPGQVICVEANPQLAQQLPVPFGVQFSVRNEALTGDNSVKELDFYPSENCEASSLYPSVAGVFGLASKITVPAVSLQALVDQFEKDQHLVVKMDIEGAELDVLRHASDSVLARISQLTVEFHDNIDPTMAGDVLEICAELKSRGFWVVKGDGPGNEDILFIAGREVNGFRPLAQILLAKGLTTVRCVLKKLFVS